MAKAAVDRSVSAVDRTLSILDAFVGGDGVRSLSELEEATGLFKSVIFRYMLSFERLGYVIKRSDGRYQLGSQVLRLGRAFERAFDMSQYVLPVLRTLTEQTRETSSFYVLENDMRLCLYRIDSPSLLRVTIHPGSRLPLDETATGQVLSRFGHPARRRQQADPSGYLRTSRNITGSGDPDHVASMSVPIFGLDNELIGALTVSGPTSRFDPDTDDSARAALANAAMSLSRSVGGKNAYPEGEGWYGAHDTTGAPAEPLRQRRAPARKKATA
ncbi:IclR family transcriptional regulator [Bordetella genomosp. 13]|uniref:IclR family transcriptional regulator n=1 Tax=Bordetella genomosp. 13 TaxID=463040 RepID=UPI0011A7E31C|nr:IclR family transcriptional regulator [Bordetella genomosp. 13]